MKKNIITGALIILYMTAATQNPATSYTNGSTNTIPGNPSQPAELYNGTNPAGTPNQQIPPVTPPNPSGVNPQSPAPGTPDPLNPSGTYKNPNGTYQNNPNTYPASPGVPNTSPGTYSPNHSTRHLFQDPMRTPKNPKTGGPVETVDGSGGKYKSHHKTSTGKNFATNRHHIKTAKTHGEKGKSNTPIEKGSNQTVK